MATRIGFVKLQFVSQDVNKAIYRIDSSRRRDTIALPIWMFTEYARIPTRIELQILDLGEPLICQDCNKPIGDEEETMVRNEGKLSHLICPGQNYKDVATVKGNIVYCPQCGARAHLYDGSLGYQGIRCDICRTETDANNLASTSPWPPSAE